MNKKLSTPMFKDHSEELKLFISPDRTSGGIRVKLPMEWATTRLDIQLIDGEHVIFPCDKGVVPGTPRESNSTFLFLSISRLGFTPKPLESRLEIDATLINGNIYLNCNLKKELGFIRGPNKAKKKAEVVPIKEGMSDNITKTEARAALKTLMKYAEQNEYRIVAQDGLIVMQQTVVENIEL